MTDDNDRMDRARRIREMREGSRPDEQSDDAESDTTADDAPASEVIDDTTPDESTESGDSSVDSPADGLTEPDPAGEATDTDRTTEVTDTDGSAAATDADGSAEATDADGPAEATDADGPAEEIGDDGSTMHIPGADVGDVTVDVAELAEQAGLDASDVDAEDVAEAREAGEGVTDVGMAGARGAAANAGSTADETRVLEFDLGDERYCLDIEYVEEIVKRETVTRVPNTPDYVQGVVDLRGQITTILDPKVLLEIDAEGSEELIVVFDPERFEDQGAIGWVVDDVNQVTPIAEDEVNDSPVDQDGINGVVDRDDEFVIWTTPELAIDGTAG